MFVKEEYFDLMKLEDKLNVLRLAGIDISGARNASSRKEEYVEDAVDKLMKENMGRINRFEYHKDKDGNMYRKYKDKSDTIGDEELAAPRASVDSTRPSWTQEFGVTRRQ